MVLIFSSCSTKRTTLFNLEDKNDKKPAVTVLEKGNKNSVEILNQTILPGDILSLRNLQNETQILGYNAGLASGASTSSDYIVEQDSMVALPFLNRVKLGGLSIPDAERFLNAEYSKTLLKNPIIKVKITSLKVTVLGEFGRVGNLPISSDKTYLTDIIADAGGLNIRANPKNIRIIRGDLKNPKVISVNLKKLKALSNDNLYLHNNDIIYADTKNTYKFLDQITSTRNIIGIVVTTISAYLLIDRLTR
ncbi:polysaccharide biosynthesis/export family protein [Pedobacter sp. SD-b]|uniref:Polysaccharide biosynthesis/export family protein n=1 Tax=Pedobacter segetis TaxID=2793069 RepID=A0ABS1BGX8_9SPHI|nr:polysaccharide biosynthesis/export family protein [Pedobacter segetis]